MKRTLSDRVEIAIINSNAAKRVAAPLDAVLNRLFQTAALRPLKLLLNGTWFGHPLQRSAVALRQKYGLLFSPKRVRRPGPKGPSKELIDAVVEMKRRNRTWGCKRVAQQIALAFGVDIDKDVVRRILAIRFRPEAGSVGPSWLSFIGHAKDSLWSLDLFRCESAILRTYWVLVVMDQFTRRVVGFAVHHGVVDGVALCGMFNRASHAQTLPKYHSSDHDPLYRFHQWQAKLRILM